MSNRFTKVVPVNGVHHLPTRFKCQAHSPPKSSGDRRGHGGSHRSQYVRGSTRHLTRLQVSQFSIELRRRRTSRNAYVIRQVSQASILRRAAVHIFLRVLVKEKNVRGGSLLSVPVDQLHSSRKLWHLIVSSRGVALFVRSLHFRSINTHGVTRSNLCKLFRLFHVVDRRSQLRHFLRGTYVRTRLTVRITSRFHFRFASGVDPSRLRKCRRRRGRRR